MVAKMNEKVRIIVFFYEKKKDIEMIWSRKIRSVFILACELLRGLYYTT